MLRSIYAKILLWFWMVALGAAATVMLITRLTGFQPRADLWMSLASGVYAEGAVDVYLHGGKPALAQYMGKIESLHGIRATLFDPQGQDLLAKGPPAGSADLVRRAQETGQNQFHGGAVYTDAEPISTAQGTFVLIAQVHPWLALARPAILQSLTLKLTIAFLCAGLLCMVLARHIAAPIRELQSAARRVADGDLSVRTAPAIGRRNDELADLARDFDRMAARIQHLLERQQELLADISHELRSPLTRLNVSLELIRRGETDAVEHLHADINRLDVLIGQILTLTRLGVHEGESTMNAVNLRPIVEGVAEDAGFEGKKEEKWVTISHADDCWLRGDPELLRSCIENVVRNAVRHTKPGTEVTIAVNRVELVAVSWAQILISDRGEGVPQESLSRLFEPFYRVSTARDLRKGGFGLGLAIAHRVALLHEGKITPANRSGGGLEMKIEFPLIPAS